MDVVTISVHLPRLPLHYWIESHLRNIGNLLGQFLEVDLSFMETLQQRFVGILVNLNVREGFSAELNL